MGSGVKSHVLIDIDEDKEGGGDVFVGYEKEFKDLISVVNEEVARAVRTGNGDLQNAKGKLSEAGEVLEVMELEANGMEGNMNVQEKVRLLRRDLDLAKNELQGSERKLLFGEQEGDESGMDETANLLDTTKRLEEGSRRIMESRRRIAETESVGASILQDLQNQRETIVKARQSLSGVDDGLGQSDRVLRSMGRRALVNKIIVYAIFALIVLLVLLVICYRIFGRKSSGT